MYRRCIFCSAALGANGVVERFPVGRTLAFDGDKGRLWAVCPRCARWNLAPLEERWEAIEDAERLFRGAPLRRQSENVGLAKMRDGTRLVRLGRAPLREVAAWRYGTFIDRRLARVQAGQIALAALLPGMVLTSFIPMLGHSLFPMAGVVVLAQEVNRYLRPRRTAVHLPASGMTGGVPHSLRWRDLAGARVVAGADDDVAVEILVTREASWEPDAPLRLTGAEAHAVMRRAMVGINAAGADEPMLDRASRLAEEAGGTAGLLRRAGNEGYSLFPREIELESPIPNIVTLLSNPVPPITVDAPLFPPEQALAFEMALHQETEHQLVDGELAALQAMWREAEQTARIADALPDGMEADDPPRLTLPGGG